MENINEIIRSAIYSTPYVLLSLKDEHLDIANSYLPNSTGFEIECFQKDSFDVKAFTNIPFIMDVQCDSGEQRFRIPNGVKGLICLYNICYQLKLNSELNEGSGIHYHIDMTDHPDFWEKDGQPYIRDNRKKILDDLDDWNYVGSYNKRDITFSTNHNWMRFQSDFKTAELRIGEMSFDYKLLVKRIIHANELVQRLKYDIEPKFEPLTEVDKQILLEYYKKLSIKGNKKVTNILEKYKEFLEEEKQVDEESLDFIKQKIKKRVING